MSVVAIRRASDKIRRELIENESILWAGSPDRVELYRRLKWFVARNAMFFALLAAMTVGLVYVQPPYSEAMVAGLGIAALLRGLGAILVFRRNRKLNGITYAMTNRRLITCDGRTGELASWFSPTIDRLKIKRQGALTSLTLGDSELGFNLELSLLADSAKLERLLKPFTEAPANLSAKSARILKLDPSKQAGSGSDIAA